MILCPALICFSEVNDPGLQSTFSKVPNTGCKDQPSLVELVAE